MATPGMFMQDDIPTSNSFEQVAGCWRSWEHVLADAMCMFTRGEFDEALPVLAKSVPQDSTNMINGCAMIQQAFPTKALRDSSAMARSHIPCEVRCG